MPDDDMMRDPLMDEDDDLMIPKPTGPNGEPVEDEDEEEEADDFEQEADAL